MKDYPWYEIVNGKDLFQGDIIYSCPLILLPPKIKVEIEVDIFEYDVILMRF